MASLASPIAKKNWLPYLGIDQLPSAVTESRIRAIDIEGFLGDSTKPQIAWLGHASFIIVWRGETLLLDPVFSAFIGVVPRRCPVPQSVFKTTPSGILISHAHMDHLNGSSLDRFPKAPIFLPEKSERFLGSTGRERRRPIRLGETWRIGALSITCVPAMHGGWRYPWQKGYFACGYLISDGETTVYFAGDTAYGEQFHALSRQSSIDIALLPIGAYAPRWFLKSRHMNPEEAVQAAIDLKASLAIPFHFGTYRLSFDRVSDALPWFAKEATAKKVEWTLPLSF